MPAFGFTEGALGTQLDLQNIQMNKTKIADAQIGLIKDKIELGQQMTMLRLMQGLKPGEGTDPNMMAGLMDQMSLIQLQSGMPDAAAKSAQAASRLREDSSKIDYRSYKITNDRLTKLSNLLSQEPDTPEGYYRALSIMAAEDPIAAKDPKFAQLSRIPWRPGLAKEVQGQLLSLKDKAEIKYRQQAGAHAEAAAAADRARIPLINAQRDYYERRDAAISKQGGSLPKAEELRTLTDMANVDFGVNTDQSDLRVRVRPLVDEAKQLASQQGLTYLEAARRVYERAKKEGVFQGIRQAPTRRGASPGRPLPVPDSVDKVQQNQWYMVDGVPKLALGTKFYTKEELDQIQSEDDAVLGVGGEDDTSEDEFPEERETPDDNVPAR